jgi:hypothetical protein
MEVESLELCIYTSIDKLSPDGSYVAPCQLFPPLRC